MNSSDHRSLGALLRHLIELLDGAVEQQYQSSKLAYRPRYTPVVRALDESGSASIRSIAKTAGLTHSAVSQTVAQMARHGLVQTQPGSDAREKIISLTTTARSMLPALRQHWDETNTAARALDAELSTSLSKLLAEAIEALSRSDFSERIKQVQVARKRGKGARVNVARNPASCRENE